MLSKYAIIRAYILTNILMFNSLQSWFRFGLLLVAALLTGYQLAVYGIHVI